MLFKIAFLLCACIAHIEGQAHYVKFYVPPTQEESPCMVIADEFLQNYRGLEKRDGLRYSVKPAMSSPDHLPIKHSEAEAKIVEVYAGKSEEAHSFMKSMCKSHENVEPMPSLSDSPREDIELRKIVDGGDQRNRIDVVFMGDGYTASEKEKFFEDMQRLTTDMFEGATFRSYLPLFNIWAVYVESQESGIGYDGGPKNTPFRLYREDGQLRGIFPGNSQYARQVCTMTGTAGCDYPSIIGNDDFYGGLGGEFVISTKSNRTGTVVLRHEMGHNFADVGEEYDDGSVYDGVNSARSLATLGWTSWLAGAKREERVQYRLLAYPWSNLADQTERSFSFNSDGNFNRWYLEVTVSAAGESDSLEFRLDGQVLQWQSSGFDDREFYGWYGNEGLTSGSHTFSVRSKTAPTHPDVPRMICSISLHEYGTEEEFVWSPDHVSAYPTWDAWGVKRFRPTNEGCLMRNMTHDRFCPVCQEGIWAQFLERISLIDEVLISDESSNGTHEVTVNTIKLGQLRAPGNELPGESLEVKWIRNNQEEPSFADQFTINAEPGNWAVQVHLNTPEVRYDPRNLLTSTVNFVVPSA